MPAEKKWINSAWKCEPDPIMVVARVRLCTEFMAVFAGWRQCGEGHKNCSIVVDFY